MSKLSTLWGVSLSIMSMLLSPELLAQPANNLICGATPLTLGTTVNSTNVAATATGSPSLPPGTCWTDGTGTGAVNNDVWFSFVAPVGTGGVVRITTTANGLTDSQMQVWRSTPASSCTGSLSIVLGGCNEDISGSNFMSQVNINLSDLLAGQTYFVQVDGWQADTGTFSILAEYLIPPPPLNYPTLLAINTNTGFVDLGTNGNNISVANNDNATSLPQNIGFTFNFGRASYTQFRLNTNGFIKLGTLAPSIDSLFTTYGDGLQNAASQTAGELGGAIFRNSIGDTAILAAFNHDLHEGLSGPTEFRVATNGTAPNRVCIIQFKNLKDKPTRSNGDSNSPLGIGLNGLLGDFYTNISFQIKLYETSDKIEFVYDTFIRVSPFPNVNLLKNAEIGIKGANNSSSQIRFAQKISNSAWSLATFQSSTTQNIMNMRIAGASPDIGRTFVFNKVVPLDAGVLQIMSLGQHAIPFTNPVSSQAAIANTGTDTIFNLPVTLTISGSNSFVNIKTIPVINPGASVVVVFDPFSATNSGLDSLTVTLPSDGNSLNNSRLYIQDVNSSLINYARPTQQAIGAFGAIPGNSVLFANRYITSSPTLVLSVRTLISNNAPAIGQIIRGVVTDSTGLVLGQSPNYTIQAGDLNTYVDLPIVYNSFPLPSFTNQPFFVGMAHITTPSSPSSFPAALYDEVPKRNGTPVAFASTLGGPLTARTGNEVWMSGAVVVNPTLPNRLGNFNLLSPASGAAVNLLGADTTQILASWSPAFDTGGLAVSYQWLLDVQGGDFTNALFSTQSRAGGLDTVAALPYVVIDDLLDALGFLVDSSDLDFSWIVRASAGPNFKISADTFDITFRRFGLTYQLCIPDRGGVVNSLDFIDSVSITGELGTSIQFRNGRNGVNGGTNNQYRSFFDTTGFALAMLPGNSYTFNIRMARLPAAQITPFSHNAVAFIDWDRNNRFDDPNGIFNTDTLLSTNSAGALLSGIMTIPNGTPLGIYRLRIVAGDISGTISACNVTDGEVEDYKLTVGISGGISISLWEEELQLFPNPAHGLVHVKFNYDKPTDVSVEVFNTMGALVKNQVSLGFTNNQISLNMQGISSGVYVVRFTTPQGVTSRRLVLE